MTKAELEGIVGNVSNDQFGRVLKVFCRPLETRGLCVNEGGSYLEATFTRLKEIESRESLRDPLGMLVWLLRDEREAYIEESRKREKIIPGQSNPFEEILSGLG